MDGGIVRDSDEAKKVKKGGEGAEMERFEGGTFVTGEF